MPPRRCSIRAADLFSDLESDESGYDDDDYDRLTMRCVSCDEDYDPRDAGTCKECYEEANENEEVLKREIDDLKAKVAFLSLNVPVDHSYGTNSEAPSSADVVLVASDDASAWPIPAHKFVLVSRSPVFKAMLENDMEESRSGTIKISDVSHGALRTFVNYLYTGEARLDDQMACNLLVLGEKYQVNHLKAYCEKFLMDRLDGDKALANYAFASQHNAEQLLDAALAVLTDNMPSLTKNEEYSELRNSNPRLVVDIYEAYLAKKPNTAAYLKP